MAAHQSSNEHEAERALVQLDALLSRYRINLTELHKGHAPKIVQKYAPLTLVDQRWTLSPSLPSEREGELVQKSELLLAHFDCGAYALEATLAIQ